MSERQRKWDQYEAVILLEGLLEVLEGKASRNEVIKRVSSDLREMARQRGEDIDDVFRNENGIYFQMQNMESAVKGYTISNKPATKLFEQMVEIYRADRQEYQRLLKEANAMIQQTKSCESDFMSWLSTKVTPAQLSELYWCYAEIESACRKAGILSKPLFETADPETIHSAHRFIEQNMTFRVRHFRQLTKLLSASRYYLTYITEITAQTAPQELEKETVSPAAPQIAAETAPVEEIAAPAPKSEAAQTEAPVADESADKKEPAPEILTVDFQKQGDYTYTKPHSFSYFAENREPCSSWAELYVTFLATLEEDYPHLFHSGMSFSANGGRIELATDAQKAQMIAPKPVPGTNYYLETNVSSGGIVQKMKYILDLCAVDYENVVIQYTRNAAAKEDTSAAVIQPETDQRQPSPINRSSFYNYLLNTQNLSPVICRIYASAISDCEAFAQEHHYASWRLYTSDYNEAKATVTALLRDGEFTQYNNRQYNQPRTAVVNLLLFIHDGEGSAVSAAKQAPAPAAAAALVSKPAYHNEPYEKVLRECFRLGFRTGSTIEVRKFRKSYMEVHGEELKESDAEISRIIQKLCIQHNGRAYLPEVMLSKELQEKLFSYIEDCFSSGKTILYYKALCTKFEEDFLDYPLYNDPDALQAYLVFVNEGRFYVNRKGISKTAKAVADPLEELRSCLKEFGRPVKYAELFAALSHLPQSKIKSLLATNSEFINNGQGSYFHESAVQISDEELENIARIAEQMIAEKDFIGGNELYEAIQAKYPYIIRDNAAFSVYGFRDALKYKLADRFSFRGNIISAPRRETSMTDVFANYAQNHDRFTLDELDVLARELNAPIYLDAVYAHSLRISQEQFVSKDQAQFPVADTDAALDRICVGDYIATDRVKDFGAFPYAGFPWNSFLLEHYVAAYSEKYVLLHAGFHKGECASAIVKRSAGLDNFDDFIVQLLADADVDLHTGPALQFLVEEGYLTRRSYRNFDALLLRAAAQRKRKGTD